MTHLAPMLIRFSRDIYFKEPFENYPEVQTGEYYTDGPTKTDTEISIIKLKTGELVITFQGTDSDIDVKANKDFRLTKCCEYPNIRVHKGFYTKWKSVEDKIAQALLDEIPRTQVVFTGHSLGGSLATIGALCCSQLVPSHIYNVVSFGGPRAGSCALREHFANSPFNYKNSANYVNGNDVIPNLPPKYLAYRDTIPETLIKPRTEGKLAYNWRTLKVFFGKGTNPDHSIHQYFDYFNP